MCKKSVVDDIVIQDLDDEVAAGISGDVNTSITSSTRSAKQYRRAIKPEYLYKYTVLRTKQATLLIGLQSHLALKQRYEEESIEEFWLSLPAEFSGLKKQATRQLVLFGSTYVCESAFSTINIIKTDLKR